MPDFWWLSTSFFQASWKSQHWAPKLPYPFVRLLNRHVVYRKEKETTRCPRLLGELGFIKINCFPSGSKDPAKPEDSEIKNDAVRWHSSIGTPQTYDCTICCIKEVVWIQIKIHVLGLIFAHVTFWCEGPLSALFHLISVKPRVQLSLEQPEPLLQPLRQFPIPRGTQWQKASTINNTNMQQQY